MYHRLILIGLFILGWSQAHFIGHCAENKAEQQCAISGLIVTDDGAHHGWLAFDRNDGDIIGIFESQVEVPSNAIIIEHDGYIFPGLIDTHNHTHWNSITMWRPGRFFDNRYEWQDTPEYQEEVGGKYSSIVDAELWDESLKYGEIRALMGGTTMLQGTDNAPPGYLVRNLDFDGWGAYSYVPDITHADSGLIAQAKMGLQFGQISRLFLHVAEGKSTDPRSQSEFPFLESVDLAIPGVVIIHGIALTQENFTTMARNDIYLVWSPKSNDVLYGETADVVGALEAGITVALAPDWTISGSDNLLEELKFAYEYSVEHLNGYFTPKQLFKMVTSDAAKVAGVDDPLGEGLGKLEVGYQADLFLAPKFHSDPHLSLLMTYPEDIQLVFVDGKPVYGDLSRMRELIEAEDLDEIVVSQRMKAVYLLDPEIGALGEQRYGELIGLLEIILGEVAPLIEDEPDNGEDTGIADWSLL